MSDGGRNERDTTIHLPPLLASGSVRRDAPRRSRASLWLALILVLVLALIGVSPYWAPTVMPLLPWTAAVAPPTPMPSGPTTTALDQRLAAVEQTLDKLARAPAAPAHDAEAAASLARQQAALQALSDRLKTLEDRPAPAAGADPAALARLDGDLDKLGETTSKLGAALADTNQRLDKLEQAHGSEHAASADRLLLVALGELRSAVENSGPYASELATVEALTRDTPELGQRLKPLDAEAATGVPSLAVLAKRFTAQAVPAILRADASVPQKNAGWSERLWRRLHALVLVRHLDTGGADASATPVDRILATAETALGKGDLAAAVDAVASLDGAPAQAAAPWLADARQRLAAETLLARLSQEVSSGIVAGDADTGSSASAPEPAAKTPGAHE